MYKRFPAAPALIVSVLATYFLVGTLSTGGVAPPLGVLFLVLVLWFSLYRFRHKDSGNQELLAKMRSDLGKTLERIEERWAQKEPKRSGGEEKKEGAQGGGEMRRANSPVRPPAVGKYAGMIED